MTGIPDQVGLPYFQSDIVVIVLENFMCRQHVLSLVLTLFPFFTYAQAILPEGDGSEIVEDACTQCHGVEYITSSARTLEQWEYIVSMMIGYGVQLENDEVQKVVRYLASNFGQK
jgi:hypothetical protein